MNWGAIGVVIKAVAPVFTAGAACFGAYIAYRGLEKWRAETIGRRKVELAEAVLADFYEAREIIEAARSPGGFGDEGNSREREGWETETDTRTLNAYYRTFERLTNKAEFFARINARRYRFVVLFGQDAAKPYDEIFKIRGEIVLAVRMLITTYRQREEGSLPEARKGWEKVIGWRPIGKDIITAHLNRAVDAIEAACRPIIQGSAK